jgi:hypothetical protein
MGLIHDREIKEASSKLWTRIRSPAAPSAHDFFSPDWSAQYRFSSRSTSFAVKLVSAASDSKYDGTSLVLKCFSGGKKIHSIRPAPLQ